MIQDCPILKEKAENHKRSKGGNRNVTCKNSNINTEITHKAIAELHIFPSPMIILFPPRFKYHIWEEKEDLIQLQITMTSQLMFFGSSKQYYIQYDEDGRISNKGISKITTRNHHVSSINSTKKDVEIGYNSTIETNIHASNHCFGKKFQIMSSIEQVCLVTALIDKLAATNNVAIVTDATAIIDYDGEVFISVFRKVLGFTKKMDKGFGVHCVDYPTDTTRKLEFCANNVFLPTYLQGTNYPEDSFCPSDNDMRKFPWVFMINETSWDTLHVTYPTISYMSQTIKDEADPFVSRFTHTLYI